MAVPPNTTAATAAAIGTLPATITLDVTDATNHIVWYTYAASAEANEIGIWAFGNLTTYKPKLLFYTGTVDDLTVYHTGSANLPMQVPVTAGTTYYIKVYEDVPGAVTATLSLSVQAGASGTVASGDLLVNDDTDGFPLVLLSPTTGAPKAFVTSFPAGESADMLNNGISLWEKTYYVGEVYSVTLELYDADLVKLCEVPDVAVLPSFSSKYNRITSNRTTTFYVAVRRTAARTLLYTVSSAGVVGETVYTLPENADKIGPVGVSPDGTIFYYGEYGTTWEKSQVHRFNLSTGEAMADFLDVVNYSELGLDLVVLSDGSVVIACIDEYDDLTEAISSNVRRYSSAGVLLNTYPIDADATFNRMDRGADDPDSIWLWLFTDLESEDQSRFQHIQVDDGTVLKEFDVVQYEGGIFSGTATATPSARFGHSNSCPLIVYRTPTVTPAATHVATPVTRQIRRLRQTPHLSMEECWLFYHQFQLDLEAGVGTATGQGVDPMVMLQVSRDHGETWSNEQWVSAGKQGEYNWRAIWRRLGRARDMVFRLVISDPVRVAWVDGYIDVTKGTS